MANGNSHQWQPQLIHRRAGTAFSPESGNSELRVASFEFGVRGSGFGSLDSQVRSPWSVRPMEWSGHGHGGAVTASSSRDSSWPMQSKTIRIRNISDDLKINMAARPTNLFVDPLAMQSIFPTARQQTTDSGLRTADSGLWTTDYGGSICPARLFVRRAGYKPLSRNFYVRLRKTTK